MGREEGEKVEVEEARSARRWSRAAIPYLSPPPPKTKKIRLENLMRSKIYKRTVAVFPLTEKNDGHGAKP